MYLAPVYAKGTVPYNSTWEEVMGLAKRKGRHGCDYHNKHRHPSCAHGHVGELRCTDTSLEGIGSYICGSHLKISNVLDFWEEIPIHKCVFDDFDPRQGAFMRISWPYCVVSGVVGWKSIRCVKKKNQVYCLNTNLWSTMLYKLWSVEPKCSRWVLLVYSR